MRRSASEILNDLEMRVAQLEKEARVKKWTAKSVIGRKWNGYMSDIQKMKDKAFEKITEEAENLIRDTLIDELGWDSNMSGVNVYALEHPLPPVITFSIKSPPKEWLTGSLSWESNDVVVSLIEKFNGEVKVKEKNKQIWFEIAIESYSYAR